MQSGNIRIGVRSYDLRPAVTGDTPPKLLDSTDNISKRYLLLDHTHLQAEDFINNKGAYNVHETHVRWSHKIPIRPFTRQEKQNLYHLPDDMLSSPNAEYLQDRLTTDRSKENIRQVKKNYYVKVAILTDPSVWELYSSKVKGVHPSKKMDEVKRRIREAFSHVFNGVSN
ncbi:hypothetical protein CHS0354_007213 [Potamilus streckersoni]|uniref:Uncharacterized protein n=1 Tax=Potamilus streckersoni TaxID=2493646 RepID=A0AAE0SLH1_9BIVA|nr:hypothetical protein CHS0354_007213 [Potamilus streckersoni]